HGDRRGPGRGPLPAPVRPGRCPPRSRGGDRDVRDHGGRHGPGAPGARVRGARHGGGAGAWLADREPDRARWPVRRPCAPGWREWVPMVGGMFFKDADQPLTHDLAERGLLFRSELADHSYPHCWRCHTPLLYYALPSWFIRTTAIKDQLLAQNELTNWQPPG